MTVLSNIVNITMENRTTSKRLEDRRSNTLNEEEQSKSDHPATKPTSVTSYIGTLVERIIIERLNWWLEHNNIITTCQAGFRSSFTTEDQLNILTQEIQNGLQMNKDMIAAFVDLEKSYDKVRRQGLFIKMRDVGIQQHVGPYRWIKNLLTDKKQSHIKKIVPQ